MIDPSHTQSKQESQVLLHCTSSTVLYSRRTQTMHNNKPNDDPFGNEELQADPLHPLPNAPGANHDLPPPSSAVNDPRHGMIGVMPGERHYNPANPLPPPTRGDFAGDLGCDPLRMPGRPTGNTMGPNHPMFQQQQQPVGYNPQDDYRSGFGMRPRFDPFGPPGVPPGPPPPRGGGNPQGRPVPGEPNPDHLTPPNSLGDDMFS
jgi:hypothetical protein